MIIFHIKKAKKVHLTQKQHSIRRIKVLYKIMIQQKKRQIKNRITLTQMFPMIKIRKNMNTKRKKQKTFFIIFLQKQM
jgi:hypothetical protein